MGKLKSAGANSVISPAVIAAQQLVASAMGAESETGGDLLNDHREDG